MNITNLKRLALLSALLAAPAASWAQVNVPASVALPASAVNKSLPGFKVRVIQATTQFGTLPNSIARAEAQLAGTLLQPDGVTPYPNIADTSAFNADGTFDEPAIISYNAGTIPGIPGSEGHDDNIALEAITYVELTPGTYSMVVNSDDGFRVTTGDVRDRLKEIVLGFFDGGRGAGDTVFNFTINAAGVYPFRLIYFEGGGGNSVDWFTANVSDPADRIHLNGGGINSYRALNAGQALPPAITAVDPAPGAINVTPSQPMTAVITDGSTPLTTAQVKVSYNGTDVTSGATITKQGSQIRVTYKPATLPNPLANELYTISFPDSTAEGGTRVANLSFTVAPYANFNLPQPLWFEGFDGVEEGSLPSGWVANSPIEPRGYEDLDDPNSDSYLNWVVISKDRVQALGDAGRWGAARRLNFPEAYINGERITTLINDQFAYHESDVRSGSQFAELISPSINLTGKTDVHLVYHSIYEQNQDNIAGVEYSINGGNTWMPVIYMIDRVDIRNNTAGAVDVVATFDATYGDVARYFDPETGEEIGGTYGAFVKAPRDQWPNYGAFISGRIDDNPTESKRIERFRLPMADNQANVKLRFFQAGTASWYFGVDNVGLYSITTIDPPSLSQNPASATRAVGGWASFSANALGEQLSFQWMKNGTDIPGATERTYTLPSLTLSDAGTYRARITNPGGTVITSEATLTVQQVLPGDTASLANGLAVYLPFNGNFNDASGNNRNGTAVGSPAQIAEGRAGGAVRITNSSESRNFVTLGSNADLPFLDAGDLTFAFWMRTEGVNSDPAVIGTKNWNSGNNTGFIIGTQGDGRLEWNYKRAGDTRKDLDALGQGLATAFWNHVVVVFNVTGDAVSYVNGTEIDRRPIGPGTGELSDPTLALNIGQDGTGTYGANWNGIIDEFAVWSRALTAAEVTNVFALGLAGNGLLDTPSVSPEIGFAIQGGSLVLTWTGEGFTLQESATLGTTANWTTVAGAGANTATVPLTGTDRYYRLRK